MAEGVKYKNKKKSGRLGADGRRLNAQTILLFIQIVFGLVVIIIAGYFFIENRYAIKREMRMVQNRLEIKTINDDLKDVQKRIWVLEDRLNANPSDRTVKEDLRKLESEKDSYVLKKSILLQQTIGTNIESTK